LPDFAVLGGAQTSYIRRFPLSSGHALRAACIPPEGCAILVEASRASARGTLRQWETFFGISRERERQILADVA
jgi:hypothetical protein